MFLFMIVGTVFSLFPQETQMTPASYVCVRLCPPRQICDAPRCCEKDREGTCLSECAPRCKPAPQECCEWKQIP